MDERTNLPLRKRQKNALKLMKAGKINAYFKTLLEMKKYKRLMIAIVSN